MLKPAELTLEEMGELAQFVPAPDPEVKVSYKAIPSFDRQSRRSVIPVCEPTLTGNEMKYVREVIDSGFASGTSGGMNNRFEEAFSETMGVKYAVTFNSGTSTLHAALDAMGVHAGDEVIIFDPAYDSYEPGIVLAGGKAVHIPLTPPEFSIDWNRVATAINPRTSMIIVNSPHNLSVSGPGDIKSFK